MNTNPITALSDLFSKLVIEHGSAVVQEKHIALLKEQFSIFERENTKLTEENTVLKSKYQVLETENKALKDENVNLKSKIQTYEKYLHNRGDLVSEHDFDPFNY